MRSPELTHSVEKVWRVCPGPEDTPRRACPCSAPQGSPILPTAQNPILAPTPSTFAPVMLQQGWSPALHCPGRWWAHRWATPSFFLRVMVRVEHLGGRGWPRRPCRWGCQQTPSRQAVQTQLLLLLWYHVTPGFFPYFPAFDWRTRNWAEFPFL